MVYWRDVPTALPSEEAYGAFMNDVSEMSGGGAIPMMVTPGNGEVSAGMPLPCDAPCNSIPCVLQTGGNYSFYRTNFFMPGLTI